MDFWSPANILVVSGDRSLQNSIREALEGQKHRLLDVRDGAQALWTLSDHPKVELAFCDVQMPVLDCLSFLRAVSEKILNHKVAVIMVSRNHDMDLAAQCLDYGAADFIGHPFHSRGLLVRVRNTLALYRTLRQFGSRARTDHLTGFFNRRQLNILLRNEMERSRRERKPLSLIYADLDHLSRVNDDLGHQTGNMVLQGFARRLKTQLRPYDSVVRYGGEEFAIIVPGVGIEAALSLAERIRQSMTKPFTRQEEPVVVTVSLGLATFGAQPAEMPGAFLARAEHAMSQAKRAGRNQAVLADPAPLEI